MFSNEDVFNKIRWKIKEVVNGDITQIDLKKDKESGLIEASRIFSETEGIKFCYLNIEDVVRHPLVQKIIEAYQ